MRSKAALVEHGDGQFLSGGGDEKVWDLAAPLAALGQESLYLKRPGHVGRFGLGLSERVRGQQVVPLPSVACDYNEYSR